MNKYFEHEPVFSRIAPVCLAVMHHGHWEDGIVAGGYGCSMFGYTFWGYGFAASPELFYMYGVDHIISYCIAETGELEPGIEIWVKQKGFTRYYYDFFPKWIAAGGKNSKGETPEAYEEIKRCASAVHLGNIVFNRVTAKQYHMPEAVNLARVAAEIANRRKIDRHRGIFNSGATTDALHKIAHASS